MARVARHLVLLLLILAVINAAPQKAPGGTALKQAHDQIRQTNPQSLPETRRDENTANGWKPSPEFRGFYAHPIMTNPNYDNSIPGLPGIEWNRK